MQRLLSFGDLCPALAQDKRQRNCGPGFSSPENFGGICDVSVLTGELSHKHRGL